MIKMSRAAKLSLWIATKLPKSKIKAGMIRWLLNHLMAVHTSEGWQRVSGVRFNYND